MTTLPIDYHNRPWKEKYLTEEITLLNRWMIFGVHPDGSVDIADSDQDIFTRVPPETAERIISVRNAFCQFIEDEFCNQQKENNDGQDQA